MLPACPVLLLATQVSNTDRPVKCNCMSCTQVEILLCLGYLLWCVYAGSSLEIKTEADSNDIAECIRDHQTSGMFGLCDDIFSAFVCLCISFVVFTVSLLCRHLKLCILQVCCCFNVVADICLFVCL